MAHSRKLETAQRRNGRTVAHYEVRWAEVTVTTDAQRKKRYRQETFSTKAEAEQRLGEIATRARTYRRGNRA